MDNELPTIVKYFGMSEEAMELFDYLQKIKVFYRTLDDIDYRFEYELINYLNNKPVSDRFKEDVEMIIVECCKNEIGEWREYFLSHATDKEFMFDFGYELRDDWRGDVGKSIISLLFDEYDPKDNPTYHQIGKMLSKYFNSRSAGSILDSDYFKSYHVEFVMSILSGNYDVDTVIKNNLILAIETRGWDDDYNPLLLKWCYENHRKFLQ